MLEDVLADQDIPEDLIENTVLPAKKSCELMKCTINNLIDYGNLQLGNFEKDFYEFNIVDMIEECCDLYEHQFRLKNLTIHSHIDQRLKNMSVRSEPQLLKQILLNLLNNSLKFSESGEVTVIAKLESESLIQIQVTDKGSGIGKTQLSHIQKQLNEIFSFFSGFEVGCQQGSGVEQ